MTDREFELVRALRPQVRPSARAIASARRELMSAVTDVTEPSTAGRTQRPDTITGAPDVVDPDSLSGTLDAVDELAFEDRRLPRRERETVARWIAARQGLPGAKSGTFAGFPGELRQGFVVFTGERLTHASARHVLGEEACRALRWLDAEDPKVQAALERADAGLVRAIEHCEHDPRYLNPGAYCCRKCSVGMWRNLASGGLDRREERLRRGVGQFLRSHRDGRGGWRLFPFWYTVLSLTEMDVPEAGHELAYAAPKLERTARRQVPSTVYERRRHALAERALALV